LEENISNEVDFEYWFELKGGNYISVESMKTLEKFFKPSRLEIYVEDSDTEGGPLRAHLIIGLKTSHNNYENKMVK
jgi:hypothetical protein